MSLAVAVINVFTDDEIPSLGNPAGVVMFDKMPTPEEMALIGIRARQPITSFVFPRDKSRYDFDVRYYDLGGRECHICGHATVAATAQLLRQNAGLDGSSVRFHLNPFFFNGEDKVITSHIQGKEISIDLFPSILREETSQTFLCKVAGALGIRIDDIDGAAFSINVRDFVVGLKDPNILMQMKPNFIALRKMAERGEFRHEGFMVSSPAPRNSNYDFYVRAFLPITGVNEDIACGSGNCSVVPYWYGKGMNVENRKYRAVFPYPSGPEGYVGGTQSIYFSPEQERITITSQVKHQDAIAVEIEPKSKLLS